MGTQVVQRFAVCGSLWAAAIVMAASAHAQPRADAVVAVSRPSTAGVAPMPMVTATGLGAAPELRAQLAPRRYTTLAAEIGARVQRLTVHDGSSIRAGEVLVEFDCSLQQAQLQRAQATLTAAEKQFATQRRLAELNATGHQELDQAEAELGKTRAEMNQIRVQMSKCRVLAPFSGRVAEQRVREQQFVQPGQPLLEVLDDTVLEVEFIMPSRWLGQVRTGSVVRIAVDETRREYTAKVLRVGARVDPVSQSVKVVAAIEGRPPELVAGMSGRVLVQP